MAVRTGAKQFKAIYDMGTALTRAGNAAGALSRLDPDRRSSTPLDGQTRLQLRTQAKAYRKNRDRIIQLFEGKFKKYDRAMEVRIAEIFAPVGHRGRPASRGKVGRPKSKRGPGRPPSNQAK